MARDNGDKQVGHVHVEQIVVIRKALQNGFVNFGELLTWIQAQEGKALR